LPEFAQKTLEVLRQPLEDKIVTIARAKGALTFPANFMLIGALNPCPCSYWGDPTHECTCTPATVTRYQKRISGPLLDWVDIHVDVPRVAYEKLTDQRLGEPSEAVRARVEAARERQRQSFAGAAGTDIACNADMRPADVRKHCKLDETGNALIRTAMAQLQLSARAFHRVLKLARTIADLAGSDGIQLAEAIQYWPSRQA
jgi:magnesium chelatase family protein